VVVDILYCKGCKKNQKHPAIPIIVVVVVSWSVCTFPFFPFFSSFVQLLLALPHPSIFLPLLPCKPLPASLPPSPPPIFISFVVSLCLVWSLSPHYTHYALFLSSRASPLPTPPSLPPSLLLYTPLISPPAR